MTRHIPQNPNYRTSCPTAIKAKITELKNAVMELVWLTKDLGEPPIARVRYAPSNKTEVNEARAEGDEA